MVLIFVQVSDASIEGSGRFHCIHTSMQSKLISNCYGTLPPMSLLSTVQNLRRMWWGIPSE